MDTDRQRRPTVLIVDDYDDERQLLRSFIEKCGYDVVEARDGEEAVRVADSSRPNLILMDIGLPQRSGISATYKILKAPHLSHAIVVAVTGFTNAEIHSDALDAGCKEVLVKPLSLHLLKGVFARYFPKR